MPLSESLMLLLAQLLFLKSNLRDLLLLLFTKERPELFAQVVHNKRVTMSDSLTLLFKKGWKCNSLTKKQTNCTFTLSLTKNEQFAEKTNEQIPNPGVREQVGTKI